MSDRVVLRYFQACGRAQPLRHALADAGIPFEDVRVPLAEWPQYRKDLPFSGPYGGLPTLTWSAATVAEALPIATFLARRLGHYDGLDDVAVARQEAVSSHAYLEVLLRIGDLIWADVLFPGVDVASALPRILGRILDKLARLDAQLGDSSFFGGPSPVVADFFAAEAVEITGYLLGPRREPALEARLPRLAAHAERIRARSAVARARATRPPTFTARPDETAVVERLRDVDLAALDL